MKRITIVFLMVLTALVAWAQNSQWMRVRKVTMHKESKVLNYSVEIDYPTLENCVYADAIREWINEELGGSYTGSLKDPDAMLNFYYRKALKEFADYGSDPDFGSSDESHRFTKGDETARFITYQLSASVYYAGAAHGDYYDGSITFRKSDGRRFDWSMFTYDGKNRLRSLIASKLRSKYGDDTFFEVPNPSNPSFELPSQQPYLSKTGVVFTYGTYEIAPFSEGIITVELPFSTVRNLLTATGKGFIEGM